METRRRIWWCLYTVEHKLGSITGRGTSISIHMCTSQLPLPFDEDQFSDPSAKELLQNHDIRDKQLNAAMTSPHLRHTDSPQTENTLTEPGRSWLKSLPINSSIYFLYHSDLSIVGQEVLDRVYTTESATVSWEDIKIRIGRLKTSIDTWKSTLPPGLDFSTMKDENDQTYWAKTNLAFHYYSLRIILGRPCLCRHRTHPVKADQKDLSHEMAIMTLESAIQTLNLLPDQPNTAHVYQFCPWWCFLHYVMQSATVIILELTFACFHMPDRKDILLQSARKSVMWLHAMSEHCIASRRAWQLCESALGRLISSMGYNVSDARPSPNPKQEDSLANPTGLIVPQYSDASLNSAQLLPSNDPSRLSVPPYGGDPAVGSYNGDSVNASPLMSAAVASAATQAYPLADTYLPHDPISDEFIQYFFPGVDGENLSGGEDTF